MNDLSEFDVKVLRILNGEDVPEVHGGAGVWASAAYLRNLGLAMGAYEITEMGKEFLENYEARR